MSALVFISMTMTATASCIFVSYDEYAKIGGWRVGQYFRQGWLKGIGALSAIGVVGMSWIFYSFWWALAVFVTGWVLSFILTVILKKHAQLTSIGLFLLGWGLQFFI